MGAGVSDLQQGQVRPFHQWLVSMLGAVPGLTGGAMGVGTDAAAVGGVALGGPSWELPNNMSPVGAGKWGLAPWGQKAAYMRSAS